MSKVVNHFYPRSPCGERLLGRAAAVSLTSFLSTLSLRRATILGRAAAASLMISIHALLAESDGIGLVFLWWGVHFYPRSPCGERPIIQKITVLTVTFLSTLSLRRATEIQRPFERPTTNFYPRSPCGERLFIFCSMINTNMISIHALLAESDVAYSRLFVWIANFYPRSPCGERLFNASCSKPIHAFLSTLSLRRATE